MKYRLFTLLALSGVLFISCVKENFQAEGGSILAVMENDDTRTSVTDEGVFTWSEGDKVWLHTTLEGVVGTLSSGAGTASANFSYGSYFGEMTDRAVYPYNEGHSISGDVLSVVMPSSYDLGSALTNTNAAMYGLLSDGRLRFNHMAGVMRFKFNNVPAGVNKFTITLDKKISGTFTADLTEAFPVIESEETSVASEKTITLNFSALTETSDIALYIPLPLGTYNSLELALYAGTNSVWTYSKSVTNTIARKSLKLMPAVTLGGTIGGDIEGGESEDEDLYATIGGDSSSKTVMDENLIIRWSEGDQIVAFMKNSQGLKYQLNDSFAGETSGRFSKVLSESSGEVGTGVEWNHVVSYYPYDESVTCTRSEDNYLINVALPAEQAYAPESFGNAASPMAAISEDNHLTFNNLCGAIRFMFKGVANIRTIELKGNADELLSGNASVTVYPDGTVPSIAMSSDASKSIILDCGAGVQLNEDTATEFIMIVPPVTFAEGFTVTITDDQNAVATISTSRTCTITRSAILSMSPMEIVTVPVYTPTDYCLTATYSVTAEYGANLFYSEIAGEENPCLYVDYGDGTKGTDRNHRYEAPGEYTVRFYFEKPICKIASSAFMLRRQMKSITIPKTVELIGERAFEGADLLDEVIFEDGSELHAINDFSFMSCRSLKEICLPQFVQSIGNYVFYDCTSLEEIYGLSSDKYETWWFGQSSLICQKDGSRTIVVATPCVFDSDFNNTTVSTSGAVFSKGAFYGSNVVSVSWTPLLSIEDYGLSCCDNLEYISLYDTEIIGNSVLSDCESLQTIHAPKAREIGTGTFCNNSSLEEIELGAEELLTLNTVGNDCPVLKEIRIPSGVTSISSSFNNDPSIEVLYVSALTPPSLSDSFNSIPQDAVIYVPCESLGVYKSASGWSSFSDLMVPYDFEKGEICSGQYHYIDEYGIDHGQGVKIGETVWAPVNCGYHATDYKYGKLYQWGRKYGQGYSGDLYNINGICLGEVSDATVPTIEEGGISVAIGNHNSNSNIFYTGTPAYAYYYDWVDSKNDKLWNSGTEDSPVRTEYDPCPEGWRVPTYAELNELCQNHSSWTTGENRQTGYWFSATEFYSKNVPQVFLPSSGQRYDDGRAYGRGNGGIYWSSKPGNIGSESLVFNSSDVYMYHSERSIANSVRCVQATDEVAEL